jgi:hypothetical protein
VTLSRDTIEKSDMAEYPSLYFRGGMRWVRKKVSVDLRNAYDDDQFRRSLGTSDKKTAVRLYPAKLAEILAEFDVRRDHRRSRDRVRSCSP